jgi:putative colanic acid biosynthesis UDP-glucose lipid carrier transferase
MSNYTRISSIYPDKRLIAGINPAEGHYTGRQRSYYFTKRGFDIIFSLALLVLVLSWLVPLIALITRLDSGGAVFFRQKRVGRNGRSFTCYKFRTMVVNDEADIKQATKDDPRITRTGRWLRRSNIDELPQLINVLAGHMSIVGPRPHMPADCERFSALLNDYDYRHLVKPGITGLAQVKGYHGPAPDYESIFHRYQWDAFYVRNACFRIDMRVLLETATQRISIAYKKICSL